MIPTTFAGGLNRIYMIQKVSSDANLVTVQGTGGQTVNGAASVTFSAQWACWQFYSNGSNWVVVAKA